MKPKYNKRDRARETEKGKTIRIKVSKNIYNELIRLKTDWEKDWSAHPDKLNRFTKSKEKDRDTTVKKVLPLNKYFTMIFASGYMRIREETPTNE
jgi:hypothetical protein